MPITALAVVPATPLLVPAVSGRSEAALDEMRAATHLAVRRLLATQPKRVAVLGPATHASFAGLGVPLGDESGEPMTVTLGRWLFRENGWDGDVLISCVPESGGAGVDGSAAERTVVLVLADGTIRRGPKSPGADDPRAEGFDARLLRAICSEGPADGLDTLRRDPAAAELGVASFGPLEAGLSVVGDEPWTAETLYDAAPFGVGSFVVVRTRG